MTPLVVETPGDALEEPAAVFPDPVLPLPEPVDVPLPPPEAADPLPPPHEGIHEELGGVSGILVGPLSPPEYLVHLQYNKILGSSTSRSMSVLIINRFIGTRL